MQGSRLRPFSFILWPFDLAVRVTFFTGHISGSCTFYMATLLKTSYFLKWYCGDNTAILVSQLKKGGYQEYYFSALNFELKEQLFYIFDVALNHNMKRWWNDLFIEYHIRSLLLFLIKAWCHQLTNSVPPGEGVSSPERGSDSAWPKDCWRVLCVRIPTPGITPEH
jgi:hypothetical protein